MFDITASQLLAIVVVLSFIVCKLCPCYDYYLKISFVHAWYIISSMLCIPFCLLKWKNVSNSMFMVDGCRPLGQLLGLKVKVSGRDILEDEEPCIYVCNHQSSLDLLTMCHIWPSVKRCVIVAKKELLYIFPYGLIGWLSGMLFINRVKSEESRQLLNQQILKLKEEKVKLWMFPEGTRNQSCSMLPFKKGAFHLAIHAQIPIVPVVFSSYSHFYNKRKRFFQTGGTINIEVLKPVSTVNMSMDDVTKLSENVYELMLESFESISREFNDSNVNNGTDCSDLKQD